MSRWVDEPVIRPHVWVVPSGQTEYVTPAGYTVRVRGDREGTKVAQFCCPEHGLFDARVSRAEDPDWADCMAPHNEADDGVCRVSSPWAGSLCGIGFAPGEVTS